MISFLAVMVVTTNSLPSNFAYTPHVPQHVLQPSLQTKEESFNFGKFLENNWMIIIAFVVFLIKLQHSVEDIKKDNKNQINLIVKDFEIIKVSLNELQKEIKDTANKKDLDEIKRRHNNLVNTVYRLIQFINDNKLNDSKNNFEIKEYNVNKDD